MDKIKIRRMIKDLTDLKRCIRVSDSFTTTEKNAEISNINNVILTCKDELKKGDRE